MLIGSELREFPQNAAYLVPPTGVTEHANLNLSKDRVDWWLYLARGRGNQQPEIFRRAPLRPALPSRARMRLRGVHQADPLWLSIRAREDAAGVMPIPTASGTSLGGCRDGSGKAAEVARESYEKAIVYSRDVSSRGASAARSAEAPGRIQLHLDLAVP